MIPRSILLISLVVTLVSFAAADQPVNNRQQRIVRRPQDIVGNRPLHPGPLRGGPNSGPRASPPPFRGQPRPPNNPQNNKKPFFIPPRPKPVVPQQPHRISSNEKSQPQVEYGFTPMNVGANGQIVSSIQAENQNSNPIQVTSETKKHTPLVINVQQQPVSYQNNNQQKIRGQEQYSSQSSLDPQKSQHNSESFIKQEQNFGAHFAAEKPKEQHSFDQFQNQQSFDHFANQQPFGSNGKRNSDPFPKIPPNFGHFNNENKNIKQSFDSFTKGPQNFNQQKTTVITQKIPGHKVPYQTQNIPLSQFPNTQSHPSQFYVPKGQFQDSKILSTGVQFHVQDPKRTEQFNQEQKFSGNFGQDKKLSGQFNQEQKFPIGNLGQANFGQDKKNEGQFVQTQKFPGNFGQSNYGKDPKFAGQFPQEQKFVANGGQTFGQDPIYHGNFGNDQKFQGNIKQDQKFHGNFGVDSKINTQYANSPFIQNGNISPPPPNVHFQLQHSKTPHFGPDFKIPHQIHPNFQSSFNQDQKFNQFFLQEPKIASVVPHGAFGIPQIQNQKLQAHYQIQDAAHPALNLQNYPNYKIPVAAASQIFVQQAKLHPEQISIPVGTSFPFSVNPNPFLTRGVVQGQVIPIDHLGVGGGIPQFTPLPQTLQFPAVDNVQQSVDKDEQESSASQTLRKVIAPGKNVSAISPAKPKKTTLKDILAEDCTGAEEFGYCASPPRYPTQQVNTILKQCSEQVEELYEAESAPAHHISERANAEQWSWSAYENQEDACVSTTATVEPGYARDASGHWLVILQHQATSVHQRVNVDVCAQEGGTCGCQQHYENKNLIAWDPDYPNQCPTLKSFKFPSKCVCPGEKTAI